MCLVHDDDNNNHNHNHNNNINMFCKALQHVEQTRKQQSLYQKLRKPWIVRLFVLQNSSTSVNLQQTTWTAHHLQRFAACLIDMQHMCKPGTLWPVAHQCKIFQNKSHRKLLMICSETTHETHKRPKTKKTYTKTPKGMLFGWFYVAKYLQKTFLWVSWYRRNKNKQKSPSGPVGRQFNHLPSVEKPSCVFDASWAYMPRRAKAAFTRSETKLACLSIHQLGASSPSKKDEEFSKKECNANSQRCMREKE